MQINHRDRDARVPAALDAIAHDMRYAVRRLVRDRGFTTAAVLILGLAIGASTAIFSVVNAVLFRTDARTGPEALVNVYQNDPAGRPLVVSSYPAYLEIAAYTDIFAATTAATIPQGVRYLRHGAVRDAVVEFAAATYLDVLRLRPALGRWFDPTEERPGAAPVAVLGHRTWVRTFEADPSVVGQVIRIEGVPVTIVGVGPANHRGTVDVGLGTDFWLPVTAFPTILPHAATGDAVLRVPLLVKARLRDGVSVAQAGAAMDVLGRRLAAESPAEYRRTGEFAVGEGFTVLAAKAVRIHPQADAPITALASVVLVLVGLVLAIACSNLATLQLVRGAAREKEISIRLAIGASRRALVGSLLTESVLLACAGGLAGCLLAWWSVQALQRIDLPFTVDVSLDYRVLAFAMVLSLATGVAFGLAPALASTKLALLPALREDGLTPVDRRRLTPRNALIVVQVAVSVLLLGGASIVFQMTAAARALPVGYAVDGVAMLETDLRFAGYAPQQARAVYDDLLRRIETIPGVQSAALLRGLPMDVNTVPIVVDAAAGQPESGMEAAMVPAGPGFFETLRIPLLYGRAFDARDRPDTPRVAIVTERMARRYFGTANAVGRRFRLADDPDSWTEVIGVARDTGTGSFSDDVLDPIGPPFYTSYTQSGAVPTTVIARTSGDAAALVAAMQRELRAIAVTLPVITARTMAQHLEAPQAGPRTVAALLAGLGGLGLVLAGIGLYAIVAFAVARRTREIGIRIALGARTQQVIWSIARGVAGLIGIGTGAGLLLSVLAMLALRSSSGDIGVGNIAPLAYQPRIDPLALLAIAGVTALAGIAAAFVPGRRAALMDPSAALRRE